MTFESFFDQGLGQEILEITDGVLVKYRGQEAFMHCEAPTVDVLTHFDGRVSGIVRLLIGQTSCFKDPPIARQQLINVGGDNFLIGDWVHPGDGEEIFIALTESTRV